MEPRSPSTRGWSIILARAALATRKVPVRLIAMMSSQSLITASAAPVMPLRRAMPALLTRIETCPTSAATRAPTTLPPSASRRSAVARPMPDAAPVTTNVRERARSALTSMDPLTSSVVRQSESELVVDDAEPDLRDIHRYLLADERVLGAGVDVAEGTLESAALANCGSAGR